MKNNSGNKMTLSIVSPKVDLYWIKNYGKLNLLSLVPALNSEAWNSVKPAVKEWVMIVIDWVCIRAKMKWP